jgi:type IV secretion system protein VirB9
MNVGFPSAISLMLATVAAPVAGWAAAPRIQSVTYDPDRVVTLAAADGYALVVELSEDERIDNIVVGNSGVWQVTANKRGDRLVIKPLAGAVATDMVVTTDTRRYVFTLEPATSADAVPFVVRFSYPQRASAAVSVGRSAATYTLRGTRTLFPITMNDDGQRTYIHWASDTPLPAIFAVGDQGQQSIVNGRMVDGDYVIEGIADSYILQRDKAQAVATRKPVKAAQ